MCSIPNALLNGFETFEQRTSIWSLPCDNDGPHQWDPNGPKARFMDIETELKLKWFDECTSEFALTPV